MNIHTLYYSVGAISIMLNLFYAFNVIPGRDEKIEFWKNQCRIWRENYFKQLNHAENKSEDATDYRKGWRKDLDPEDPAKEG